MYFTHSIFNNKQQNYKLWRSTHPEFDPSIPVSFSSEAYKPKGSTKQLGKRHFFLKGNFLCYKKKSTKKTFSGIADLSWARVVFKEEEDEDWKDQCSHVALVIKEEKFTSIHFKNEAEADKWREAFKRIVTLTDFHEKYEMIKEIGRGSYGRVIFIHVLNFFKNEFFSIFQ